MRTKFEHRVLERGDETYDKNSKKICPFRIEHRGKHLYGMDWIENDD